MLYHEARLLYVMEITEQNNPLCDTFPHKCANMK